MKARSFVDTILEKISPKIRPILYIGGISILFLCIGFYVGKNQSSESSIFYSLRVPDPENKLINPLVIADTRSRNVGGYKVIEDKLKLKTYDLLNIPGMKNISIYYRDLKSNIWAGVGSSIEYDPASLLKVPIMIAWLKLAQENPSILSKKLLYRGAVEDGSNYQYNTLRPNNSYTVDFLLKQMIQNSDNNAKDLLLQNIDTRTINPVFTDLGIETWGDSPGSSVHISASTYSRFLRILYNATYLNHEYSEKALELLTSSNFNEGIIAGIPSGLIVAHKFGQFQDLRPSVNAIELHDCGIVYEPSHPYLLCVMTRATADTNINILKQVIKTVSETAYKIAKEDIPKVTR